MPLVLLRQQEPDELRVGHLAVLLGAAAGHGAGEDAVDHTGADGWREIMRYISLRTKCTLLCQASECGVQVKALKETGMQKVKALNCVDFVLSEEETGHKEWQSAKILFNSQ